MVANMGILIMHDLWIHFFIAMMKTVSGSKGPNFTQGDVDGALKELGLTNELVFKY